ncbi:MAG: Hpt domain-containing protein [Arenibacter algicola]|nr:Hpt domain-containing protein [Arenibacter algicola]
MPVLDHAQKTEDILARLSQEFVETARDQLDDVEVRLDWLESGRPISDDDLFDIQRNIHNIKGQGSTFGYPLVGRVAHKFEDYLANAGGVLVENVREMRVFIDTITELLNGEQNLSPSDADAILRGLPDGRPVTVSSQKSIDVEVLLVMPSGVQRRFVAQELLSCGFSVSRAYDTLEALSTALDTSPDMVFVNNDMTPFSGRELARVFASIDRLRDTHIVLLTGYGAGDEHLRDLPKNLSVVEKRQNFGESIGHLLMDWGVFGPAEGEQNVDDAAHETVC